MRRPFALGLASLLSAALLAVPTGPAAAQQPPVRLTLLEQSPQWNGPGDPTVTLRIRAENAGQESLGDLSIGVTLWPPVYSRSGFEQSLEADPTDPVALLAETRARTGTLPPGGVRDFVVPVDLPLEQLSSTQSLIYPLKVDLRSGYRSLAAIRTPVIYLVRRPLYPVAFSWTFVLRAPFAIGPDGTFETPALETSISRGGRLAGQISALRRLVGTGIGVDVVVSPLLLFQLLQMRDGYRVDDGGTVRTVESGRGGSEAAADAIERLREIASSPNVELSALPYAEPLLPSLTSGGLARDLGVQLHRGRDLVAAVLGRAPSASVFRPPRSALDETTLDELPAHGISTLLLDPGVVPRTEDAQGFAPPPVVSLAAQNATLSAVIADPAAQALVASDLAQRDPVLAAQAVLGELASIWLQAPGEQRGLAMTFGEDVALPGPFFAPLVRGIAGAPWLAKRTASVLATDTVIERDPAPVSVEPARSAFSTAYVRELRDARRSIAILRTMLVEPSDQPARLDRLLLLAESQRFVDDERGGLAFIDRVAGTVGSMFNAVRPQVTQPITLTSSAVRDVPIVVHNTADVPLRVTIRLESLYLRRPVEATRVLPPRSTETVGMDLELRTTGRFEVDLRVVAPSGDVIGGASLVVRSTAFNRIALVITIGAAVLAMLVWARRFLPRRTV